MYLKVQLLEKVIRKTESILAALGGGMLFLLMLLGTSDVIGRYVFNSPIVGTLEISEILLAGIVFFSWAYIQAEGGHVRVDLLLTHIPPRFRAIANFITLLLSLALFSVIIWQSTEIALIRWEEHRLIDTINIPSAPFYFLVPFGALLLCIELILQMLRLIPKMKGEE